MTWTVNSCPPILPTVFVVGVEDRPNGATRIYVDARWKGLYVLLDREGTEAVRRAWGGGGHVFIEPSALEGLPIFREEG